MALPQRDIAQRVQRHNFFPEVEIAGERYYPLVADLHLHSNVSDGQLSPEERIWEAAEAGLDAVALTDHSRIAGNEPATRLAEQLGLILIPGTEIQFSPYEALGHVVVLGLTEPIDSSEDHTALFAEIERQEAIAFWAHPGQTLKPLAAKALEEGKFCGIEVINEGIDKDSEGVPWGAISRGGIWFYPKSLNWAAHFGVGLFAVTDMHDPFNDHDWPRCKNVLLVKERSVAGALEAVKAGRCIAWFKDQFWAAMRPEVMGSVLGQWIKVHPLVKDRDWQYLRVQNLTSAWQRVCIVGGAPRRGSGDMELPPYETRCVALQPSEPGATLAVQLTWANGFAPVPEAWTDAFDTEETARPLYTVNVSC